MRVVFRLSVLCAVLAALPAQEFRTESVTVAEGPFGGRSFRYRVFVPDDLAAGEELPVLLFLHGAGERGDDNEAQLRHLPERMVRDDYRARFRCIVVAPQCARSEMWMKVDWNKRDSEQATADSPWLDVALAALHKTLAEESCDRDRIYLTGLSMGGFGSWHLAARAPELFAAVVPVCGGGDPASAAALARLPFFVWHGASDNVVPPDRSRAMVRAVRAAGGIAHYVELPGVRHDSWNTAYRLQRGALDWLFARRRGESYPGHVMACDATAPRVVLLALDRRWDDAAAESWEWRGEGLGDAQRGWFAQPTDVKPTDLGTAAIVTTSAGGVFKIRIADKKVLFAAHVDGELRTVAELPDGSLVVAATSAKPGAVGTALGDRLVRIDLAAPDGAARQSIELDGVRALHWDDAAGALSALVQTAGDPTALVDLELADGRLVAGPARALPTDFARAVYDGIELDRRLPGARIVRLRLWP